MENLTKALIKAQSNMPEFKHNAKGVHKATYATLDSIINAARPVLNKYGLAVIQTMKSYEDLKMSVITKLMHESGECIDSEMIFSPSADPQKVGGQITYYRRYAYQSIIGVCTEKDDDADSLIPGKSSNVKSSNPNEPFRFVNGKNKGKLISECDDGFLKWCIKSFDNPVVKKQATEELAKRNKPSVRSNLSSNDIPF